MDQNNTSNTGQSEAQNSVNQTAPVVPIAPLEKSPRRKKKVTPFVWAVVLILVIAAAAVYLLGYFYVGFKNPNQQVAVSSRVCDAEIVGKYNDLVGSFIKPLSDDDTKRFKVIADSIKTTSGYEDDPTCQAMLFQIGYITINVDEMDAAYESVQKAHDRGAYPDNELRANTSPSVMKEYLKEVKG